MHVCSCSFFVNDAATTEIYTLSLRDALPILAPWIIERRQRRRGDHRGERRAALRDADRKSTRLNSSHLGISYAVFCLKKKKHAPYDINAQLACSATSHCTSTDQLAVTATHHE